MNSVPTVEEDSNEEGTISPDGQGHAKKIDLSIVIPVLREEKRITKCIRESQRYFKRCPLIRNYELIFVADRSGDRTIDIIREEAAKDKLIRLIVNETQEQKGGSVQKGLVSANYDTKLYYDADLSTPLSEVERFLKIRDQYDLLIASRGMKESIVEKKWHKMAISYAFSLLKWAMFGLTYKDTQCGFKMFNKSCDAILERQRIKSGIWDVELLLAAKKNGFRIIEIPVKWDDHPSTNLPFSRLLKNVIEDMPRIKINQLSGQYTIERAIER
jgi:glycosyltransferase involved in cell wall biosynthesis